MSIRKLSTSNLTSDPYITAQPWIRHNDWLTLPSVSDVDQVFYGLLAIYDNGSNNIALMASGDYTIDWGDGTITNYAAGTTNSHLYSYASISTDTLSSRGYKQVIVKVFPQDGHSLTNLSMNVLPSGMTLNHTIPWLDVVVSSPVLYDLRVGNSTYPTSSTSVVTFRLLEQFTLKSHAITDMYYMFAYCESLQSVPLFDTSNVTYLASMFAVCTALQEVPYFDFSSCIDCDYMFDSCTSLITIPPYDTSAVPYTAGMFNYCTSLQHVPSLDFSSSTDVSETFNFCYSLREVPSLNISSATDAYNMFSGCVSLEKIGNLICSNLNDVSTMFRDCASLTSVPLFNTSSVTDMSYMFSGCKNLISIPPFDTSTVTDMDHMFTGCSVLTSIPLIDTSSVTDMTYMFDFCENLETIPLLNTSSVTSLKGMFDYCGKLRNIPQFNTTVSTDISYMAYGCSNLVDFNITKFPPGTANVFGKCDSLARITTVGIDQSFTVTNANLSPSALNEIYTNLASVTAKVINVTGNWGTSSDNPSIATAKGWTVTG